MSDRGTSEAVQIRLGLKENDQSPWEYGVYVERCDDGDWTPLVYGEHWDYDEARVSWRSLARSAAAHPGHYRNPRIVRRAVGPWEVTDK